MPSSMSGLTRHSNLGTLKSWMNSIKSKGAPMGIRLMPVLMVDLARAML